MIDKATIDYPLSVFFISVVTLGLHPAVIHDHPMAEPAILMKGDNTNTMTPLSMINKYIHKCMYQQLFHCFYTCT